MSKPKPKRAAPKPVAAIAAPAGFRMSKPKPKRAAPKPAAAIAAPALLLEADVLGRCRPALNSRAQLWKLEQAGRFPPRKKYGFRRVAWVTSEIDEWIAIGADAWADQHSAAAAA